MIAGVGLVANRYQSPITHQATGVAYPVVILIVVTILMSHLARRRRFGRYVYAYGGNPEAAELSRHQHPPDGDAHLRAHGRAVPR